MTALAIAQTANDHDEALSDRAIIDGIGRFEHWFAHVNFGNGIIARSTYWPDAPLNSRHMGVSKFDYIVRPNLPDLQGKRVLELGCNAGINAIHMCRLGAREIVGIDSAEHWPEWLEQARFVRRALEWRCGTTYPVRYVDADIAHLPTMDLGRFDVIVALNCLYYLQAGDIHRVIRRGAEISDVFLIQCNTRQRHERRLRVQGRPPFMVDALMTNGYGDVSVDWPWDHPRRGVMPQRYHRPVVVGRKSHEQANRR